jgi:hypothetical protein
MAERSTHHAISRSRKMIDVPYTCWRIGSITPRAHLLAARRAEGAFQAEPGLTSAMVLNADV